MRILGYIGVLILLLPISSWAQDISDATGIDPFAGLISLDFSKNVTFADFKEVFDDGEFVIVANFEKRNLYERLKNQFNSDWENQRINGRTRMNELRSQLLLNKAKYKLFESQKQVLESEVRQLEESLHKKKELKEDYENSEKILGELKGNLLKNYLYYGIFYAEFDVPTNHAKIQSVNLEQFRDYGERLITDEIKESYIKTIVYDTIWRDNGIEIKRELIKEVEMLNVAASFHMALDLGPEDNPKTASTRHVILAAAIFKNDGSSKYNDDNSVRLDDEIQAFSVLDEYASHIKSKALFRNSQRSSRIGEITDMVDATELLSKLKREEISSRLDTWNGDAMEALERINTSNAFGKWQKDLATFKSTSAQILREKDKVTRDIEDLKLTIRRKKGDVANLQASLDEERREWESVNPVYEAEAKEHYKMLKNQVHYALVLATNPRTDQSPDEASYEAILTAKEKLENDRVKELLKTVRADINGYKQLVSNASVKSHVSVEKVAILGFKKEHSSTGIEVELPIAVKMVLTIPDANIKKPEPLLPPWQVFTFDPHSMVVTDLINQLEWKRIKLTADEDEFGNDFLDNSRFPDEVTEGNWRVPEIGELLKLGTALSTSQKELRDHQILVDIEEPLPFWSNTLKDNGNSPFVIKKGAVITADKVTEVELEITDSGYFLFVRKAEK